MARSAQTRRSQRARSSARRPPPGRRPPPAGSGLPIWWIAVGLVVVCAIAAVVFALTLGGDDDNASTATTDPTELEPFPELAGTTLDGAPLTITPGERPMIVLFVAHWCPHCQREIPRMQDWIDAGNLPADVALYTVSTAVDPNRPNYPPGDWLDREGWTAPTLDDPDGTLATQGGVEAFPFVAVDGDGRVVQRTSGELTNERLDEQVDLVRR